MTDDNKDEIRKAIAEMESTPVTAGADADRAARQLHTWCITMHAVHLDANPHRADYKTPAAFFENDWPSEDAPDGIEQWDALYVLQVYPATPVGFVLGTGETLAHAVEQVARALEANGYGYHGARRRDG